MNDIASINNAICTAPGGEYGLPGKTVGKDNTPARRSHTSSETACSPLIRRSIDLPEPDWQRLDDVRLEMEQSRLDSPDNIRSSAQIMLNLGI